MSCCHRPGVGGETLHKPLVKGDPSIMASLTLALLPMALLTYPQPFYSDLLSTHVYMWGTLGPLSLPLLTQGVSLNLELG